MPIRVKKDAQGNIERASVLEHGPAMFCTSETPSCETVRFDFLAPSGSQRPWVYFVGDAPSKEDMEGGEPFQDSAGAVLTTTLEAIQPYDDFPWYRLGNTVSCRPVGDKGNDRTPTTKEIRTCSWFVQADILKTAPVAIVLLGKGAVEGLLPSMKDESMNVLSQQVLAWCGMPVYARYHPKYILTKGGLESEVWQTWADSIQEIHTHISKSPPF